MKGLESFERIDTEVPVKAQPEEWS